MSLSSYTTDKASPFARAVVSSMRKLYPEALADKSFDNTGLLLEAPFDPIRRQMNSVLLTIDLTKAVADEAIERKDCVVVAYHPIIFKGLKSLTLANTQQQSLLRLALEGISVYCPHTAIDAAPGGLGDWLADIVTGKLDEPEPATHTAALDDTPPLSVPSETNSTSLRTPDGEKKVASKKSDGALSREQGNGADGGEEGKLKASKDEKLQVPDGQKTPAQRPARMPLQRTYSRPTYPAPRDMEKTELKPSAAAHKRAVIHPITTVEGFEKAGMGRLVTFSSPQPLTHLIERIARGVGSPKGFPVAIPQGAAVESIRIRSVAICAGSGAAVLRDVACDLIFTGELSHHEALAATERGACVVTLFHSNTERGFLHRVLKAQLEAQLRGEWERVRRAEREKLKGQEARGEGDEVVGGVEEWEDALADASVLVEVSEVDRDPFGVVVLQSEQVGREIRGEGG